MDGHIHSLYRFRALFTRWRVLGCENTCHIFFCGGLGFAGGSLGISMDDKNGTSSLEKISSFRWGAMNRTPLDIQSCGQ